MKISGGMRVLFIGGLMMVVTAAADAKLSAAKAWKEIEKIQAQYAANLAADRTDETLLVGQLNLLQMQLEGFVRDYPQDNQSWLARIALPEIKCQASKGLGAPFDWQAAVAEIDQITANPALPADRRGDAEYAWIALTRARLVESPNAEGQAQLMTRMEAFCRNHPKHKLAGETQLTLGDYFAISAPERAERMLKLAARSADEQLANKAEKALAVLPYRRTPLDLAFTALDGRPVSIAALRGKIVVVDFWATWCGPCLRELPRVIDVYRRYRDQGLEVIGISLDDDTGALKRFLAKQDGMTWPQYFDGGGWNTKVSRRFSIMSIPEMWLLDKEGRIVSTEIWGGNLEQQVKALLKK